MFLTVSKFGSLWQDVRLEKQRILFEFKKSICDFLKYSKFIYFDILETPSYTSGYTR